MNLQKHYAPIMEKYPAFITQVQMCEICGISKKTAYNLERREKIPYTVEVNHLIHTHKIRLTDVLAYLYEKECRQEADSDYILSMRSYYQNRFAHYPDVLTSKDIESMTGFSQSGIAQWLKNGILKSMMIKTNYRIPKVCLIDFVVSPYYRTIKNKSAKQRQDIKDFEVWHEAHPLSGEVAVSGEKAILQ